MIKFKYDYTDPTYRVVCTCTLEYNGIELQGKSHCSHLDQFRKETGRKIALTRAIENLSKNSRRDIWRTYHSR